MLNRFWQLLRIAHKMLGINGRSSPQKIFINAGRNQVAVVKIRPEVERLVHFAARKRERYVVTDPCFGLVKRIGKRGRFYRAVERVINACAQHRKQTAVIGVEANAVRGFVDVVTVKNFIAESV